MRSFRNANAKRSQSVKLSLLLLMAGALFSSMLVDVDAFHPASVSSSFSSSSSLHIGKNNDDSPLASTLEEAKEQQTRQQQQQHHPNLQQHLSRRNWLSRAPQSLAVIVAASAATGGVGGTMAMAAEDSGLGEVTDKVFVDVSGLSADSASAETQKTQRIVLGLFGRDAPASVQKLKLLHATSGKGLEAPCKPLKEDFLIQREQLEANKVYRSCLEGQDRGVTYDYAQIWRIVRDERIDFGSLSGKFNAREYPTWAESPKASKPASGYLSSTSTDGKNAYLVAVRKGSDSGFGYTLFPTSTAPSNKDFLENYLVVGRVLEGGEVVDRINNVSVVQSSKSLNYMSIVGAASGGGGGASKSNAPKKDCRYGGPMYCNENKPLTKLTMFRTGIL